MVPPSYKLVYKPIHYGYFYHKPWLSASRQIINRIRCKWDVRRIQFENQISSWNSQNEPLFVFGFGGNIALNFFALIFFAQSNRQSSMGEEEIRQRTVGNRSSTILGVQDFGFRNHLPSFKAMVMAKVIHADWRWLMLIKGDWCWLKVINGD